MTDVRDALHAVGVLSAIQELPDGLDTVLTLSGRPLTGSQVRRLMLARAIVGNPTLLLIDGLLDGLPDAEARDLVTWLSQPGQPWTLLVCSGRTCVESSFTEVVELPKPPASSSEHRRKSTAEGAAHE